MRYYLHIHNAVSQPDDAGSDFADERLALAQAALTAGEILRAEITTVTTPHPVTVVVEDEGRRRVGTITATLSLDEPT